MTHDPKTGSEDWLDRMLDDVATRPVPDVSPDLMARVLADAEALLPPPPAVPAPVPIWRQILDVIGGWSAVGGLAVAGVTGLAIGLGAFDTVGLDAVWSVELFEDYDSQIGLTAFGWDYEEG